MKQIHSEALRNIERSCEVEIKPSTYLEFCSKRNGRKSEEAEQRFRELLSSVDDIKVITLRSVYDKAILRNLMPDTADVVFYYEGDVFYAIGPEQNLRSLNNFQVETSPKSFLQLNNLVTRADPFLISNDENKNGTAYSVTDTNRNCKTTASAQCVGRGP